MPFYLGEHRLPACRALHFVGTTQLFVLIGVTVITRNPGLIVAWPLTGYGFAWLAHFVVEKNRPATFRYPLWSLVSDFRLWGVMMTGRLWRGTEPYGALVGAAETGPVRER